MYLDLSQAQISRLNYIRTRSRWRGVPMPAFICLVIDDWLSGGLYLDGDGPFSD